ncbi:hypothetical protein DZ858_01610 [Marixanthomonas ophiurae]|uniref:Uncharacterized protein n=2 Tax=Marixanthomonas ophiurae TaxID=387659 RepID=A0A3E1Q9L9_9FLAO|nr:hypothetical protein DZ858_01610 [Marixanthomonas ophiurae]
MSGQTTGPTQPEAAGFAPIGVDDMVNLYTGDFNYNIPLMVIPGPDGGYPINVFYNSNVGMDQAASWVGLGWNLNAGAIQRNLRGTPDDFKGDLITKQFYTKPSTTINFDIAVPLLKKEIAGAELSIGSGFGVYYNNYSGLGINVSLGTTLNQIDDAKNQDGFGAGLGLSFGSQEGFSLTPSLSYSSYNEDKDFLFVNGKSRTTALGATINSKQGFGDLNLSHARSRQQDLTLRGMIADRVLRLDDGPGLNLKKSSFSGKISFASSAPISSIQATRYSTNSGFSFTPDPTKSNVLTDNEIASISGNISRSWVTGEEIKSPAFGAMYMANKNGENAVTDFYRENEGPITKDNVLTGIPVLTYDVFSIQGHGVGGSFRAYQNSIGRLADPKKNSISVSESRGIELGGPGAFKAGFDFTNTYSGAYSGAWKEHYNRPYYYLHELYDYKFNSKTTSKPLFEPFYFKMIGEASAMDTTIWEEFQTDKPIAFDINLRWDYNILAAKAQAHSGYNRSGNTFKGKENEGRSPRTQNIEYFTKDEIENSYTSPHIVNYDTNKLEPIDYDKGKGYHLNGISVLKSNGVRYNYFLPAYNHTTEKVTFSVPNGRKKYGAKHYYTNGPNGDNPKIIESIAPYINTVLNPPIPGPSYDVLSFAKVNNKAGEDEFYSRETIPAYAHTFFITSILSQDYVDIKNDGPTMDDIGTYIKMNYEKVRDYKWRFPFKGAYYSKGYLENTEDDKASYQEGEKDLFYVKSIETKTHIAVFETKNSELVDASETKHQKELVSITLYSKADPKWVKEFYLNQPSSNWPSPIQTVHLNQDYSLKKGIPNTTGNEMAPALKELYFTYQNSTNGENAKYQFNYGVNPDYSDHQQDRWGAYQEDQLRKTSTNSIPDIQVNENPYTYQEENYAKRDNEASAWLLNEITLPSKGGIKVEYEKDDYAYVQDKKATSYIELLGTGDKVYTNSNSIRTQVKTDDVYLYFKSPFPLNNDKKNVLKQIEGIEFVRFRVFMELKYPDRLSDVVKDLNKDMAKDYVEGYAEVEKDLSNDLNDLSTVGYIEDTNIGYFKIKSLKPKNSSTYFLNPIRLAAFQYIRKSRPDLGVQYDGIENAIPTVFFTKNILSMLDEASTMITGYYKKAQIKGWASQMNLDKPSYVRLISPERKYGGGARVKRIKLKSDETNAREFGQTYDYTLSDGRSSGVAEWEPILGIEETPFTLPIWYNANNNGHKIIFSNEQSFSEEPLGAGLYPSASVGYSRVTVRNLENDNVTMAQSGINISEFYTAKDFPTKAKRSGALFAPYWAPVPIPFIGQQNTRYNGYSMGYSFTLNNSIYGRPKSVATYPYTIDQPTGEPIQKSVYKYKTLANDNKSLDNKVMTLLKEGNKKEVYMGKEIDFYIDEIEANTYSIGLGGQVNISYQPPTLVLPSFFPKINTGRKGTRYLTTNKIIYNTPILDSIIQYKDGAKVSTKNLVFDHETGEPIITSVTNEWKQLIYTYNFPAHWTYEQMKGAYKNYRATVKIDNASGGKFKLDAGLNVSGQIPEELFQDGDVLIGSDNIKYYISEIDRVANTFNLKSRDNSTPTITSLQTKYFTIMQSGYKNLQSTKKGKIVSLEDPTDASNITNTGNIPLFMMKYNN